MNKKLMKLLIFILLLINLQSVTANQLQNQLHGVTNNVTINILDNGDAVFSSINTIEIQDDKIIGHFEEFEMPLHKNITPESIILTSNKDNIKYSINSNFIVISDNDSDITFSKGNPMIINLQYKIKNYLIYNSQNQLYFISLYFNSFREIKYYNLSAKIIFPFNLEPISGLSYIPFLGIISDRISTNENFSVTPLQISPPILQINKNFTGNNGELYTELVFDLLPSPPKMKMEINEELNLDNTKYKTITKVTNFYNHELCYILMNEKNSHNRIAIQDCNKTPDLIETSNFYHLKPDETSFEP